MFKYVLLLLICFPVFSAEVTGSWDANIEPDLAGYKLSYGSASGNYEKSIDVGNVLTVSITDLEYDKTYYFAVKAYDTSGNESGFSNEVQIHIPALEDKVAPNAPKNVKIVISSAQFQIKQK